MSPNRRSAVIERLTLGARSAGPAGWSASRRPPPTRSVGRYPGRRREGDGGPARATPGRRRQRRAELAELPRPGFVLAVGTLEPRKNLPRLVAAYAALPATLQDAHPLVVVGATGWRDRRDAGGAATRWASAA